MKKVLFAIIVLIIIILGYYFVSNFFGEPQKVKINSIEITNVYRNCTKNAGGNYIDTTIQTTVNVDVTKTGKNTLRILARDTNLKIGPNEFLDGFSLNKIPTPNPYVEGIDESGLYMITGGELSGDKSDTLTFCYEDKCDVATIEICK